MRSHRLAVALASTFACAGAFVIAFLGPSVPAARAYVRRTSTDTNIPLGWRSRTVNLTGYAQGLDEMTLEQINNAMMASAAPWTKSDPTLAACTDLDLQVQVLDADQTPPNVANDKHSIIAVRRDTWEHEAMALALTSVFFYKSTGEIVEADVEVNAVDFQWVDVDVDSRAGKQDLQNALTHEMGHFIGLDHPCYLQGTPPDETDQAGNPVPNCAAPAARTSAIQDSTMFPSALPRDTSKRTLSPDDQQAVCDIYPAGRDTVGLGLASSQSGGCNCEMDGGGGDAHHVETSGVGWRWLAVAGLGAAVILGGRPRRKSRRGDGDV